MKLPADSRRALKRDTLIVTMEPVSHTINAYDGVETSPETRDNLMGISRAIQFSRNARNEIPLAYTTRETVILSADSRDGGYRIFFCRPWLICDRGQIHSVTGMVGAFHGPITRYPCLCPAVVMSTSLTFLLVTVCHSVTALLSSRAPYDGSAWWHAVPPNAPPFEDDLTMTGCQFSSRFPVRVLMATLFPC